MANTTALVVASPTPQPWRGRSVLLAGVVLLGERIFADDIVAVVPGMRVMTKADSLGMFTSGRMKFVRYETSETKIRTYDDTAL